MPLPNGKARFWMIFFSLTAFLAPFFAVLGIEYNKRLSALREEKDTYTKGLAETAADREQYQADVEARKQVWQQKMTEAKNKYEATKATQADAIAKNRQTVTVKEPQTTTYTPPPIKQTVTVSTPTPTTTTSTPKTTTKKTKTS